MFRDESRDEVPFEPIRLGIVSSIDKKKCTAKVFFEERDETVSHDLPVIQKNTMLSKYYWMPDVGETVICLFLANGQETGFILGSIYSDIDKPPPDISERNRDRRGIWIDGYNYVKWVEEAGEFLVRTEKPVRFVVDPPWPEWEDDYG